MRHRWYIYNSHSYKNATDTGINFRRNIINLIGYQKIGIQYTVLIAEDGSKASALRLPIASYIGGNGLPENK